MLVFSQRRLQQPAWHATQYEWENLLTELDDVDLLAPPPPAHEELSRLSRRALNGTLRRVGGKRRSPPWRVPNMQHTRVAADHDLFFAVFHNGYQLSYLHRLRGWRQRCRRAACVLVEMWSPDVEMDSDYLRLLAEFDVVYLFNPTIAPRLRELGVRNLRFLPTATDALLFSPVPNPPTRVIDVYNYGRASDVTHRALLDLVERSGLTYVYDTMTGGAVRDAAEHRALLANMMKRSRFFLTYRINDSPDRVARTGGDEALSTRYFEGAAGGAVMLGSRPSAPEFDECFDWPDVVIPMPSESPDVAEVLASLAADPDRVSAVRAENVRNSLLRHDWSHRWRTVLGDVGLPVTDEMDKRQGLLDETAALAGGEMSAEPGR